MKNGSFESVQTVDQCDARFGVVSSVRTITYLDLQIADRAWRARPRLADEAIGPTLEIAPSPRTDRVAVYATRRDDRQIRHAIGTRKHDARP